MNLKTHLKISLIIATLSAFISCSKDEAEVSSHPTLDQIQLTTLPADSFMLGSARLNAESNLDFHNFQAGFLLGTQPSLTIGSSTFYSASFNHLSKRFSFRSAGLQPATIYYARAVVKNSAGEVNYGNEVSFSLPENVYRLDSIRNISPESFRVYGTITGGSASPDESGAYIATHPNPGPSDLRINVNSAFDDFTVFASRIPSIQYGTTYYIRAYQIRGGIEYTTNAIAFKPVGYTSASGGYVFFDKGNLSDGWRYLELAPDTLDAGPVNWGCHGTFINGLAGGIGNGYLDNATILSQCIATTSGAYSAANANIGGNSGWHLPTLEEAEMMQQLDMGPINFPLIEIMTSEQETAGLCTAYNMFFGERETRSKNFVGLKVWPIRRY